MKNYYQILGISETATKGEIRKAYLRKAKEFHPDVNKSSVAESKFKEIQEAYSILSDEGKKSSYDYNRQYYNYQQPYQDASEWADYFRQEAERQNQHNYQNPPQTPPPNESNFENDEDEINNQSTLFVILLLVVIFIMAIVIYYVGVWSSLICGYMLYLLYRMYQGSKNTS